MAKRVQRVRHETAASAAFTGLEGEITVDLGKKVARVHDGLTPGGKEQAAADLSNVLAASAGVNDGKMTAAQALIVANAAPTISPALTGSPTAPKPVHGNSSLLIPTTSFVQDAVISFLPPTTGGVADTYTATVGITAYVTGTVYKVRINAANTGSATMALDGLAARTIKVIGGATLFADELPANHIAELFADSTDLILLNPAIVNTVWGPALNAGGGTVLTTESLLAVLSKDTCTISGKINVSFILTPTGGLTITGFPYSTTSSADTRGEVHTPIMYNSLGIAATLGMKGIMLENSTTLTLYDITTTGQDSAVAPKIQVGTTLGMNFTYPVR